jgi:tyrosine-protein kinase Etk/Wzc
MSERQLPVSDSSSEELGILDVAIVLAKRKKLILLVTLLSAVAAVIFSLSLPNIFTATTKILPPQQAQSTAASMLGQFSGLAGLSATATGIKSPNDVYVGMLKSRTVADNLIQRFDLNVVFGQKLQSSTRAILEGVTRVTSGRDGIITVEVDDKSPGRAAELANGYIDELYKLTSVIAVTEASQRRLFYERQLAQAKTNLSITEASAKQALQRGGVTQVEGQGRAMLEATARLRGQITVKEVQIGAMRAFAADANPELRAAQLELDAMKRQLGKIEGSEGDRPTEKLAAANGDGTNSLALLRDVKYHETIFELLTKQFQLAKLDEARDSAIIQVLDKAIVPDRKSKPTRSLFVILVTLAAGVLVTIWAFVDEARQKASQNPEQARRLDLLRRYLWGR